MYSIAYHQNMYQEFVALLPSDVLHIMPWDVRAARPTERATGRISFERKRGIDGGVRGGGAESADRTLLRFNATRIPAPLPQAVVSVVT